MNNKSEITMNNPSTLANIISWLFGIVVLAVGLINAFWGNDSLFGVFIALAAFVYFPPVNSLFSKVIGFTIPVVAKIILGIFIIWAVLGVGELFDKIELMKMDL